MVKNKWTFKCYDCLHERPMEESEFRGGFPDGTSRANDMHS
jgi:hypothetical protein